MNTYDIDVRLKSIESKVDLLLISNSTHIGQLADRLVSREVVQELLGCSKSHVDRLWRTGAIKRYKVGKLSRARLSEIYQYMDSISG